MGKENQSESSTQSRTIFVSGLPYTCTEEEIRQFFEDCGTIEQIKLPKFQDSGRSLGYGHITFSTEKEAKKSFVKNNAVMGKRYIVVEQAKGEKEYTQKQELPPPDCRSIFIKNLPYDITSEQIGDAFRHCGLIENVRMVFNTAAQHFKGFCYIDFRTNESVLVALKMNGKKIQDRVISVDFEVGKPKMGFKYNQQQKNDQKYNKDINEISKKKIKKDKVKQKKTKIQNYAEMQKEELKKQVQRQI